MLRRSRRLLPSAAALAAALLCVHAAQADRVAVLPARGGTDDAARQAAQADIVRGLAAAGHTAVPESEVSATLWAVLDGVPDTADEYRTVGTATKADWVLVGLVEPAVTTHHVEIFAFHAATGRVESVAREIEPGKSAPQIQEMLAVLVRPEGIGAGELPWERAAPPPPPQPEKSATAVAVTPPPAQKPPETPAAAPPAGKVHMDYLLGSHDVWPPYSGGKRSVLSVTQGFAVAVARSEGATGSGASYVGALRLGYAFDSGFEPFLQAGTNLFGPPASWVDLGLRVMFTPSVHRVGRSLYGASIHFGVEGTLGAFIRPGSDPVPGPDGSIYMRPDQTNVSLGLAGTVIVGLTPSIQLEAQVGNLRWVPAQDADEGTLFLMGATLGAGLRF